MPLPTDQFKAQARKAGRTMSWRIEAGMAGFFAVFIGFVGLLLISSVPWFGIVALLPALAIAGYAIRRISVGRHRDLICPNCGVRGEIVRIEHSYQFHCSRCDQTADTGVSASGA
jgi:ribosomal protein S27AE